MPRKTWTVLALILMVSLLVAACGGSAEPGDRMEAVNGSTSGNDGGSTGGGDGLALGGGTVYDSYAPEPAGDYEMVESSSSPQVASRDDSGSSSAFTSGSSVVTDRMIIRTARYAIETEDYAETMDRLDLKILTSGAYVESMESRGGTEDIPAWANMTIRVPIASYGSFKEAMTGLGYVRSSFEDTDDVTAQFYDTESRLSVLRAQEERILELFSSARDLDEIFYIESELTRIRTEIEQLTTVVNRLSDLVAYATVKLEILEVFPVDTDLLPPDQAIPFGQRMSEALSGSLTIIVMVVQLLVLIVLWCWPLLIIIAVVLFVMLRVRKKRAQKQEQQRQELGRPLVNPAAFEKKEQELTESEDNE